MPKYDITNVTVAIEVIDPITAAKYLEHNTSNRPLSEVFKDKFVNDILEDRYIFNGQSIVFALNGKLLDGQHRLEGVIATNESLPFVVVRGVREAAFETMDSGKPRTAKDVLGIMGTPKGAIVASAVAMIKNYENNLNIGSGRGYSRKEITDFVKEHKDLIDLAMTVADSKGQLTAAPLVAALYLANRDHRNDEKIKEFLHGLKTGENLSLGNPILALREWAAIQRARAQNGLNRDAVFSATAKAWNAYITDAEVKQIKALLPSAKVKIEGFQHGPLTGSLAGMRVSKEKPQQLGK